MSYSDFTLQQVCSPLYKQNFEERATLHENSQFINPRADSPLSLLTKSGEPANEKEVDEALLLFYQEHAGYESVMKDFSLQEPNIIIYERRQSQIQEYFQRWKRDLQPDGKFQKKFKSSSPQHQYACIIYLDLMVNRCRRFQFQEEKKQFEALLERLKKKQRPLFKEEDQKQSSVSNQNTNDSSQRSLIEKAEEKLPKEQQKCEQKETKQLNRDKSGLEMLKIQIIKKLSNLFPCLSFLRKNINQRNFSKNTK